MSTITIRGLIVTTPREVVTETQEHVVSFRLAESNSDMTNWYTVSMFGHLAINAGKSFAKGQRVIIVGDLRIRDWDNGERSGTSVEVKALTAGHDVYHGITSYERAEISDEQKELEQAVYEY